MLRMESNPFIDKLLEDNTFLHFPVFTTRRGKLNIRTATLKRRVFVDYETREVDVKEPVILDFGNASYHFCNDFLRTVGGMDLKDKGFCIDFGGDEYVEPVSFLELLTRSKEVLEKKNIPILEV